MASQDVEPDDLEGEGIPDLFDGPTGKDIETAEEALMPPRDHPVAVTDYGVTALEERVDEPLSQRVQRENPDFGMAGEDGDDGGPGGRLVDPGSDPDVLDTEEDALGSLSGDDDALTAEEAAMRIVPDDSL
jgi:hypothetical protein